MTIPYIGLLFGGGGALFVAWMQWNIIRLGRIRAARNDDWNALQRTVAFSAGFRCGQEDIERRLHMEPHPISDWQRKEAANAVAHGFTPASEFAEEGQ